MTDLSNNLTNPMSQYDQKPQLKPLPSPNPNDPSNISPTVQQFGGVGYHLDKLSSGNKPLDLTPTQAAPQMEGVNQQNQVSQQIQQTDQTQSDKQLKDLQKNLSKIVKSGESIPSELMGKVKDLTKNAATSPGKVIPNIQDILSSIKGISGGGLASTQNIPEGISGGQCGHFVNTILGNNIFGDSYQQKLSKINTNVPSPGSVAIIPTNIDPQYGHVAMVESVNQDGSVNVVESNWGLNEKVGRRRVGLNTIAGFYNPNL